MPMSQENANEKTEKTPRKKTSGCLLGLLCFLTGGALALYILWVGPYPFPLNTMPITGTITVLDEHGKAMPFQPIKVTCFSHYAPLTFFRSEIKRKQTFHVNELEQLSLKIPEFSATLCFFTEDKKCAAVVAITPDMPPTNLTVELRPRYTVTGRLVNRSGTPLANQEIELISSANGDQGAPLPFPFWSEPHGYGWEFHKEATTTDSEGFFTIDNVIPGIEYVFVFGKVGRRFAETPILEPERYKEPFCVGDVVVP